MNKAHQKALDEGKVTKRCPVCNQYRDFTMFKMSSRGHLGLSKRCITCEAIERKKRVLRYKAKHPEKVLKSDREYKQRQKDMLKRNPEMLAEKKLKAAVSKGLAKQDPCFMCNDPVTHPYFSDYSRPYNVVWLCTLHFNQRLESHPPKER